MQYRSPTAALDHGSPTMSTVTSQWLFTIQLDGALGCFFRLSCSPNYAMQINVYNVN